MLMVEITSKLAEMSLMETRKVYELDSLRKAHEHAKQQTVQ